MIKVTKCILLSLFIGGYVDCKKSVVQFVTADSDTVYSLNQRGRTHTYCFAGPVVRVSPEHNTRQRENKVFLNLTVEEEEVMFIRDRGDSGHSMVVAGTVGPKGDHQARRRNGTLQA